MFFYIIILVRVFLAKSIDQPHKRLFGTLLFSPYFELLYKINTFSKIDTSSHLKKNMPINLPGPSGGFLLGIVLNY